MANMSAEILRNLISSCFNIEAKKIILSGEIAPNTSWQDTFHDGSMGDSGEEIKVWGFNPQKGFISLDIVGRYEKSNYAHSSTIDEPGKSLEDVVGVEEFLFFIIRKKGYSFWSGSEQRKWDEVTLYKAPNFFEYWIKMEAYDIARWEQWLNNNLPFTGAESGGYDNDFDELTVE